MRQSNSLDAPADQIENPDCGYREIDAYLRRFFVSVHDALSMALNIPIF